MPKTDFPVFLDSFSYVSDNGLNDEHKFTVHAESMFAAAAKFADMHVKEIGGRLTRDKCICIATMAYMKPNRSYSTVDGTVTYRQVTILNNNEMARFTESA